MSESFTAEVVQYLRPYGRKRLSQTNLPLEVKELYLDMLKAGFVFTAEILSTGIISMTISNDDKDADMRLVINGPKVQEAMVELLRAEKWKS